MTPFGRCLRMCLCAREMTQAMLASKLEKKPSYLSMIINGTYLNQPTDSLVKKIINVLRLSDHEAIEIMRAVELSRRSIVIPAKASAQSYVIAHEVLACIKNNETEKLERISKILKAV